MFPTDRLERTKCAAIKQLTLARYISWDEESVDIQSIRQPISIKGVICVELVHDQDELCCRAVVNQLRR
jgi:hypothetical protein